MKSGHHVESCLLDCPWHGTCMCAQLLLNAQALADRHISLGVFFGLKQLYQPHVLPPCIVGDAVDWVGPKPMEVEAAAA